MESKTYQLGVTMCAEEPARDRDVLINGTRRDSQNVRDVTNASSYGKVSGMSTRRAVRTRVASTCDRIVLSSY